MIGELFILSLIKTFLIILHVALYQAEGSKNLFFSCRDMSYVYHPVVYTSHKNSEQKRQRTENLAADTRDQKIEQKFVRKKCGGNTTTRMLKEKEFQFATEIRAREVKDVHFLRFISLLTLWPNKIPACNTFSVVISEGQMRLSRNKNFRKFRCNLHT